MPFQRIKAVFLTPPLLPYLDGHDFSEEYHAGCIPLVFPVMFWFFPAMNLS